MAEPKDLMKYLELFQENEYGEWVVEAGHAGAKYDPFPVPYVDYGDVALGFERIIYEIDPSCPELGIHDYVSVLEMTGLEWSSGSLGDADVTGLDEQCILVMCLATVCADRFSEGVTLQFLKEGHIQRGSNDCKIFERLQTERRVKGSDETRT